MGIPAAIASLQESETSFPAKIDTLHVAPRLCSPHTPEFRNLCVFGSKVISRCKHKKEMVLP